MPGPAADGSQLSDVDLAPAFELAKAAMLERQLEMLRDPDSTARPRDVLAFLLTWESAARQATEQFASENPTTATRRVPELTAAEWIAGNPAISLEDTSRRDVENMRAGTYFDIDPIINRLEAQRDSIAASAAQAKTGQVSIHQLRARDELALEQAGLEVWLQAASRNPSLVVDNAEWAQAEAAVNTMLAEAIQLADADAQAQIARVADRNGLDGIIRDYFGGLVSSRIRAADLAIAHTALGGSMDAASGAAEMADFSLRTFRETHQRAKDAIDNRIQAEIGQQRPEADSAGPITLTERDFHAMREFRDAVPAVMKAVFSMANDPALMLSPRSALMCVLSWAAAAEAEAKQHEATFSTEPRPLPAVVSGNFDTYLELAQADNSVSEAESCRLAWGHGGQHETMVNLDIAQGRVAREAIACLEAGVAVPLEVLRERATLALKWARLETWLNCEKDYYPPPDGLVVDKRAMADATAAVEAILYEGTAKKRDRNYRLGRIKKSELRQTIRQHYCRLALGDVQAQDMRLAAAMSATPNPELEAQIAEHSTRVAEQTNDSTREKLEGRSGIL